MHKLRQINRDDWNPLMKLVAELIGDESAMMLFIRFSGRHLRIPMTPNPDHLIDQTIGTEKANILRKNFSGEVITFPNCAEQIKKNRNKQIIKDWKDGMFQADIATKYELSERHINTIISRQKAKNTE